MNALAEAAGIKVRSEKLDWMYQGGVGARQEADQRTVVSTANLGKAPDQQPDNVLEFSPKAMDITQNAQENQAGRLHQLPSFYSEDTPATANEMWQRLHSDPLFIIKQKELALREKLVSNPRKLQAIKERMQQKSRSIYEENKMDGDSLDRTIKSHGTDRIRSHSVSPRRERDRRSRRKKERDKRRKTDKDRSKDRKDERHSFESLSDHDDDHQPNFRSRSLSRDRKRRKRDRDSGKQRKHAGHEAGYRRSFDHSAELDGRYVESDKLQCSGDRRSHRYDDKDRSKEKSYEYSNAKGMRIDDGAAHRVECKSPSIKHLDTVKNKIDDGYGMTYAKNAPDEIRLKDRKEMAAATQRRLEEAALRSKEDEAQQQKRMATRREEHRNLSRRQTYRSGRMTDGEREMRLKEMTAAAEEHEAARTERILRQTHLETEEEKAHRANSIGRFEGQKSAAFLEKTTREVYGATAGLPSTDRCNAGTQLEDAVARRRAFAQRDRHGSAFRR